MIKKAIGVVMFLASVFACVIGSIFALFTIPLVALVFSGELTWWTYFRLLSVPAVLILTFPLVWRLDPWGGTSTAQAWQNRTGPVVRERMQASPFWQGVMWVAIVCQIMYLVMTISKLKELRNPPNQASHAIGAGAPQHER